jgi:hemerythrin-like domain-containing protein
MSTLNRREVISAGAVLLAGVAIPGTYAVASDEKDQQEGGDKEQEEQVTPAEDLMREHGVLRRILFIYDEILWRRLAPKEDFSPQVLVSATDIVRRFVEDYHEKLEEEYLFPRFRKQGKHVALVDTLLQQHQTGRTLTDAIRKRATPQAIKDDAQRAQLMAALRLFARMYRPHAAREDTVLFPALRSVVSAHEYDALGEEFEEKEHKLFGEDGFEKVVAEVAGLEKQLGLNDLASFTPSWKQE